MCDIQVDVRPCNTDLLRTSPVTAPSPAGRRATNTFVQMASEEGVEIGVLLDVGRCTNDFKMTPWSWSRSTSLAGS